MADFAVARLVLTAVPPVRDRRVRTGADRAAALLASGGSYGASVYYNTACFESRAGRIELAIDHLRTAIELAPSYADLAREDEDFTALHERPGWVEIIGS